VTDSFPRLSARTGRFTLGIPRSFTVSPDGSKVWFVRTPDGTTRTGQLFELNVDTGVESLLVDPRLLVEGDESLSTEERARRERSRESGAGIIDFSVDRAGRWATFALSGQVWAVHLGARATTALPTPGGAIDPRVDPTGRHIAYVSSRELRVVSVSGRDDRSLAVPASDTETWGLAEFIAAEELGRYRGFWWSPDGTSLLVERQDEAPVQVWHVADPADPAAPAVEHRYPVAGSPNAQVTLWHIDLHGNRSEIRWDRTGFEYLASVVWNDDGPPVIHVLSRDQKRAQILSANLDSGTTKVLRELSDPAWIDVTSAPQFADGGRLVSIEDHPDRRRLVIDGTPVGDARWQVRHLVTTQPDGVLVTASVEPSEVQVVRIGFDGTTEALTEGPAVHTATAGGSTVVIVRSDLDQPTTTVRVHNGPDSQPIASVSEPAPFTPTVRMLHAGPTQIRTAILFPRDHQPGSGRLPVLMNPYGGPHAQRVLASARMFLEPQWLADQGFCVVVADGRGTPGRDPEWERAVLDDLATPVLEDQITALQAVSEAFPDVLDLNRVGIMGWSFGGYLAALAVLRRPDVFHAAVAGAPVTDWRLYDTAYTERYLGDPHVNTPAYEATSLLPLAPGLTRPLLLIHGLADDNVFAAHTLQLSAALTAAGRPHDVLPLSGITHMASQETVAEGLATLQAAYLTEHLQASSGR
jgi:dipeptidyl-peptidase-4